MTKVKMRCRDRYNMKKLNIRGSGVIVGKRERERERERVRESERIDHNIEYCKN